MSQLLHLLIREEQVEVPELRKALRREEAKNAWKNKSGALTRKMNKMNKLMSDQANVEEVQEDLQKCIEILESSITLSNFLIKWVY